jgi:hypothetical protein
MRAAGIEREPEPVLKLVHSVRNLHRGWQSVTGRPPEPRQPGWEECPDEVQTRVPRGS